MSELAAPAATTAPRRDRGAPPDAGIALDPFERRLLEHAQRDLALASRPYAVLAAQLDSSEATVLAVFQSLRARGVLSRVGPVFDTRACGASTLAALAVPAARLDHVAATVNSFPEVNHNYAREHEFNLWFVLTASDRGAIDRALAEIARRTDCTPIDLPMTRAYHVDLGFVDRVGAPRMLHRVPSAARPDAFEQRVIAALEQGLELTAMPYREVALGLGVSENELLDRLHAMCEAGLVKRIGAVVHHRALGLDANAMVVWQVADAQLDVCGQRLARSPGVTLSYARRAHPPRWPFNLYCMVHARSRAEARRHIEQASDAAGLAEAPRAVLFSTHCYRQRGAHFARSLADG